MNRNNASAPASRAARIQSFAELRAVWREDRRVNGGRILEPGFQALAVHRFGVWVDGLRSTALRFPLRRLYFVLNHLVEALYGIRLYYTTEIGRRLQLAHGQCGVVIARECRIGDDCVVRQNVTLGKRRSHAPSAEVPWLGDRVEIGAGAVIIGPVNIGDDTLIGPNVVVQEDVPARSVVLPPSPETKMRRSLSATSAQAVLNLDRAERTDRRLRQASR